MMEQFYIESWTYDVLLNKHDLSNVNTHHEGFYVIDRITEIEDLVCEIVDCFILDLWTYTKTEYNGILYNIDVEKYFDFVEIHNSVD